MGWGPCVLDGRGVSAFRIQRRRGGGSRQDKGKRGRFACTSFPWRKRSLSPTDPACAPNRCQVMRNKQTGQSDGYGFVEFASRDAAEKVLAERNGAGRRWVAVPSRLQAWAAHESGSQLPIAGTPMPSTQQAFRINWASFGIGARRPEGRSDVPAEYSVFVGDLSPEVNDLSLLDIFKAQYPSVRRGRCMMH